MRNNITVGIHTLGCRVNMYESCAIAERLQECGITVKKDGDCDFYIVNTCAVTAESERKSRQLVRRSAKKGKVLVIGCSAQIEPALAEIDNVIYVGGNCNKMSVVDVILNGSERVNCVCEIENAPYEEIKLNGTGELFSECRAFVKIQDGCNGKCTYCIIPKCRGRVRSRNADDIISEVKRLVANGYHEVILTGIEVGAYNKIRLHELIKMISCVDGIERIRLGSLSPNIITESFLSVISQIPSFMHHIHLSLQSCNDEVLGLMMRPYKKKDIIERIALIRKYLPDCMISADIIVGFPGETEEYFLETLEALKELRIFHLHSFPYSERKGTPAAVMPNSVPKHIRSERNARLISACAETKNEILSTKIGCDFTVLVEKIENGIAVGHTNEFFEARFNADCISVGDIVEITAISHDGNCILA